MVGILISTSFLWGIVGLTLGGLGGYFATMYILIPLFGEYLGRNSVSVGFNVGELISSIFLLGCGVLGGAIAGLFIAIWLIR